MSDSTLDSDPGLFETMYSMRAMRKLKTDPIPEDVLHKVLDSAIRAPSGQNTQAWKFLALKSDETRQFFGERYLAGMLKAFENRMPPPEANDTNARTMRAALHLAEHMHEVPVILLACGKRDWPFRVAAEDRVGKAPPSYGSIYPAVQNLLLAARGLGLGASLTTMHQVFEDELCEYLGIPDEYGVVAAIPMGYPMGKFGPVRRVPIEEQAYLDKWDQRLFR